MTPDYRKLYFNLMGKVADTIDQLIQAMCEAEDQYCREEALLTEPCPTGDEAR